MIGAKVGGGARWAVAAPLPGGTEGPSGLWMGVLFLKRGGNYTVLVSRPNWAKERVFCDDDNFSTTVFSIWCMTWQEFGKLL